MRFSIVQDSRTGGRKANQDRVGHAQTDASLMMVVADGMGGHYRGEVAAQITLDSMLDSFRREAQPKLADPELFLSRGVGRAHIAILQQAREQQMPDSPRTVVVACVVQDGHVYWSHIGDSRAYLVRKGRVIARTKDHSYVQTLVDAGRIREESIPAHPDRNRVTQCLGGPLTPRIEPVTILRLEMDDVVLLCSDGLWGQLTQRQLLNPLIGNPIESAIPELVQLSEKRYGSGSDNISVVAMRWGEAAVPDPNFDRTTPVDASDVTPRAVAGDPNTVRMSEAEIDEALRASRDAAGTDESGGTT